ncbi:AraC family transcriptional regulator [uncultured Tateyamaria sp.]|uniref:helix-turn-helix domain-containing protein n=1 Tax=uncultured Tateyamaria sp. TaxID=455651 RepID=UPI002636ABEF|nr:AraC family transcriptional regulator [uncultured Tateyamaria sp.]
MGLHLLNRGEIKLDFESWPPLEREVTVGDVRMLCLPAGKVDIVARRASHTINIALNSNRVNMAFNSDKMSEFSIASGSMGYFPKSSTLKLQCENKVPEYLIEIGDQTIRNWKEEAGLTELVPFEERNPYQLDMPAADLARLGLHHLSNRDAGTPADKLMCEAIILGISARFVNLASAANLNREMSTAQSWIHQHSKDRLKTSIEYAFENLSNRDLRISDMANVAGISSCHYSEVFKEAYGCTPYAFIKEERLKYAKDLILHSRLSISEISYACAFSSQSHLTTALSARFGASPGQLRRSRY